MPEDTDHKRRKIFTSLDEAVIEIQKRHRDETLKQRVREFLAHDIPAHFDRDTPVLYLSRHVATPNYEALRFVELGKPHGLPLVIGQDRKGKFVSHNEIKKPLGKMPVTKGFSKRLDEIIEYFTIIDFAEAQGKPFADIKTKAGLDIVEFHNSLFREVYPSEVEIHDEADWIDRNARHDLLEQYQRMLAIVTVYGVMFESYTEKELELVDQILLPALEHVQSELGYKPLIVEHITPELEVERDWNGYPSVLYQFIKRHLESS